MSQVVHKRTTCRTCGSDKLHLCVPLAAVPVISPNVGIEGELDGRPAGEVVAPLDNYLCLDCGLIQLLYVVDPALIYGNYRYRTSISLGLADHFRGLAGAVMERVATGDSDFVVEFGSNDGTLLSFFRDQGRKVIGVDPAKEIAAEATAKGVPTIAAFFDRECATAIRREHGAAKAIIANNAMANIDDLDEIVGGISTLLAPDGAFVFETQYGLDVFEKTLLDVIYHEHISCFSVKPVRRLFERFDMEIFDAERIPTKGGSIRFWAQHAGGPRPVAARVGELEALEVRIGLYDPAYFKKFSDRIQAIEVELHRLIAEAAATGRPVAAYGTSVGCAALIHQFGLADKLDFAIDDNAFKDVLEGPGYRLPIRTGQSLYDDKPAAVVVLAWRYMAPIAAKHPQYLAAGGKFIVPLPEVTIVK